MNWVHLNWVHLNRVHLSRVLLSRVQSASLPPQIATSTDAECCASEDTDVARLQVLRDGYHPAL